MKTKQKSLPRAALRQATSGLHARDAASGTTSGSAEPERKLRTGVIECVSVVPFGRTARFAVELRTARNRLRIVQLPGPTVTAQFVFQIGKRVTLPVERGDNCWQLRLDKAALKVMRQSGAYDPDMPAANLLPTRRRSTDRCRWLALRQ